MNCSDSYANISIIQLKAFFETLPLLELENVPQKTLILPTDIMLKSKKEARYFTPQESQNMTNVMRYMENTDAKIIFCLKILAVELERF